MAIIEAGQEKHSAELEEMINYIREVEAARDNLQNRLDGVLAAISRANCEALNKDKPESTKFIKY